MHISKPLASGPDAAPGVRVLVASRDPHVHALLDSWLFSHQGGRPILLENPAGAVCRYRSERPEFVVLDVTADDDLAVLEQFRKIDREIPIVVVTTGMSAAQVVGAMRLGAADVLRAPFDAQTLHPVLDEALAQRRIRREMAALRREVRLQTRHTMLFGTGQAMADLRGLIDRVADTDVPVLIQGETGTGKELVARALAASSARRSQPLVKINCAALPGELFEAELFGFERGAFTGARQSKPGKFEIANGGTIFLDEIGEIPVQLQSKLLQVLQDGCFTRVGGREEIRPDVRVVAATNRDQRRAVVEGQFREDLLFRLNVIPMRVPPLRERRDDIPALVEFFLKRWAVAYNRRYAPISPEMLRECMRYDWPGNIRELENMIQRTVILRTEASARRTLAPRAIVASAQAAVSSSPRSIDTTAAPLNDRRVALAHCSLKQVSRRAARQAEGTMIVRMLEQTQGNRRQAAVNLGICYKAFLYKAKEHGW